MDFSKRSHQLEVSMARFVSNRIPKPSDSPDISDILNIDDLKDIMHPFYASTGLGVGIFDNKYKLLASSGWQKICTHFHQQHPESHKSCAESEGFFKANFEPQKTIAYKCNNGLWDISYPLYLDDNLVGSIRFGQFFYTDDSIEKEFFLKQAQKFNFDQEAYFNQLKQVPILSKQEVENFVQLFIRIIEKLANINTF